MSTKPFQRTSCYRSSPYPKQSPRKVAYRNQAIYVRPDGTQFQCKKETEAKVLPLVEKPSANVHSEELIQIFLAKNIDLRGSVKVGGGRYSSVYTAKELNKNGNHVKIAMKIINEKHQSKEVITKFLPREIDCWKKLEHPYLVRLLGYYYGNNHTYLTMEFADKGDMLAWVQRYGAANEFRGKLWAKQIIEAIGYMHGMGIAHRDLKLENIMIFHERMIKIGDFGFSKMVGRMPSATFCGSKSYSAPEILSGQYYNPFKSDIWAVGIVIFIFMSNHMPFKEDQPNTKIIEIQKHGRFNFPEPPMMSDECCEAIMKMLKFHPQDRPKKITEILKHPWFQ